MEPIDYPTIDEVIKDEGRCPICLSDLCLMPKYKCDNDHFTCLRCKPYYYSCSVCQGPFTFYPMVDGDHLPPPTHFMPHPMPRSAGWAVPSAPEMDFMDHERIAWGPPPPQPDQFLAECGYSDVGCRTRIPEFLREVHETRCQFRPLLELEHLPTDLPMRCDVAPCTYSVVGCNVMVPPWRKPIHEPICVFKKFFDATSEQDVPEPEPEPEPEDDQDPDELVECKLKIYGCLVRMPRRRKNIHEEKCNYNKFYKEEDFAEAEEFEVEDPESQVDCCWAEHGCRIRPKLFRKETHEQKCNYRMEDCSYKENGCEESLLRARRFAHERNCEFRN